MTTPLVLYVNPYRTTGDGESFFGFTPRNEHITGWISQRCMADPVKMGLTIDGIVFKAPEGMNYAQTRDWMVKQIENLLNYFVIEVSR